MSTVLKKGSDLYKEYFYQCYTHADIVFSILHFLALNKYKFNKCAHCERFFPTQNLKNLYCSRFSQFPEREKYSCYEAVKRIKQDIKRKHTQIYKNLSENYLPHQLNSFESKYSDVIDELNQYPNYHSINKCYKVVDKKRWYNKKSIRTRGEKK